jgi:hypothetical protein
MLGEVSMNSPGAVRISKSKKGMARGSPYGNKKGSRMKSSLSSFDSSHFVDDSKSLLSPGRPNSLSFVPDKHCCLYKRQGSHGLEFKSEPSAGVVVSAVQAGSQGASKGVLVGDVVYCIDSMPVAGHIEAMSMLGNAMETVRRSPQLQPRFDSSAVRSELIGTHLTTNTCRGLRDRRR